MNKKIICLSDIELEYYPRFFNKSESQSLFLQLKKQIGWQEESYQMFGKEVKAPRLVAWYGDIDAHYKYTGKAHEPMPWINPLSLIREKLSQFLSINFNSVLANLYRDGQDSIAWHSDNEKELGPDPIIASLSLGESRIIKFIKKDKSSFSLALDNGSLLVMRGNTQSFWQHSIAKTKKDISPRINLTFRKIFTYQNNS